MKIKYLLPLVVFSLCSIIGQNLNGKKIYINPGHGGHDSNDRFIEATGFWESEGNLTKGLYLRDLLDSTNAITAMSRVTNFTADDKPLSTIVAEANAFGADYFHSIHSNGYNGQANYTLVLFRGTDANPANPQSKVMGQYIVDELYLVNNVTAKYNRGDYSFLGYYLGVLSGLNMVGTLSEGSFHDYIPESWRLMNLDYRENEANAISRGIYKYYSAGDKPVGEVAGILRDPTKTVSYYYITSLGDNKKPINNFTVTLQPGGKFYNGDNKNNGYFIFDSLAPGPYKVYYQAEGFFYDSASVTVTANKTVWAIKDMAFDYTIPPSVLSHSPTDTPDSIRVDESISITFSRQMNKTSVESAFNITPTAVGSFTWESGDTKLTFTQLDFLQTSTIYNINIDTTAVSHWGYKMDSNYTFNFTTKSKDGLRIISHYPADSQQFIPCRGQIRLVFNSPIHTGTLSGAVKLLDEGGISQSVTSVEIYSLDGKGYINFEPSVPLNRNAVYNIFLDKKIGDLDGYKLRNDIEIFFTTKAEKYTDGFILDGLEDIGNWVAPSSADSTTGVDTNNTNFSIVTTKKIGGSKSGKLQYKFHAINGVCQIQNSVPYEIGAVDSSIFGIWVFGDLSHNILEYWFYDNTTSNIMKVIDTIDWAGWDFKYLLNSEIGSSGDKQFHSLVIRQSDTGLLNGTIYIDNIQKDALTNILIEKENLIDGYRLYQNYPNPFNPTTKIRYSVPTLENKLMAYVQIKVYDMLGREIATIVNEEKSKGNYEVEFNAKNLASGLYFYTMKVGNFIQTKKMLLLK
ncbi:MAG: Ig-like domain-containing protein [Ignavibacteriales bacterium]|nr:Ig-like domain-containing protein [Ignavibacteriales bacterium]